MKWGTYLTPNKPIHRSRVPWAGDRVVGRIGHLRITKETNVGRMNTSLKLQGNQNNQQSYIKHAKMTDEAFATYLRTKSQHPNVQQMLKTRRQIGKLFLETGRWMPKEFATSI